MTAVWAQGQAVPFLARFSDTGGLPSIADNDPMANPRGFAARLGASGGSFDSVEINTPQQAFFGPSSFMLHTLTPELSTADFARGSLNAPLVVVHYGDFECPYSGALTPLLLEVKAQLEDKMCLVFRPFPLDDIHPHAMQAALAAEAAAGSDQFWPMHDLLFQNQDALENEDLTDYAEQIGLDLHKFSASMKSNEARQAIEKSQESGHQSGAHGTPTLFVNGTFHDNREGLWRAEALTQVLQAALDNA